MTPSQPPKSNLYKSVNDRLKVAAQREGVNVDHLRKQLCVKHFLSRRLYKVTDRFIVKGALLLEASLALKGEHLTELTRDADLAMREDRQDLEDLIRKACEPRSEDPYEFEIYAVDRRDNHYATLGFRIRVYLDGREFTSISLDVVSKEPSGSWSGSQQIDLGTDIDGDSFGVLPAQPLAYALADKLHAYVRERSGGPNIRYRDLPDMVVHVRELGQMVPSLEKMRKAVSEVFALFGDEPPKTFPSPPETWPEQLKIRTSDKETSTKELYETARTFWNPVLAGENGVHQSWGGQQWEDHS